MLDERDAGKGAENFDEKRGPGAGKPVPMHLDESTGCFPTILGDHPGDGRDELLVLLRRDLCRGSVRRLLIRVHGSSPLLSMER